MAKAAAPYLHPKQLAVDQRLKGDQHSEAFKEFLRSIDGESRRLPQDIPRMRDTDKQTRVYLS